MEEIIEEFINGSYEGYPEEYSVCKSMKNKKKDNQYVYNEFSFQHELGNYLRYKLNKESQDKYIVKFEYNINDLLEKGEEIDTCKKEIDILIIKKGKIGKKEKYAIELKYLKNKAAPYRMFQCIKDMKFMNDVLKIRGIKETYCVTITENKEFYSNYNNEKILFLKDNEDLLTAYKEHKEELIKKLKELQREELKNKEKIDKINNNLNMFDNIIKENDKYPLIYEYFRKADKDWERKEYVFSNLKNDLSIIDIGKFKNDIKFSWKSVDKNNKNDNNKYYIIKFEDTDIK